MGWCAADRSRVIGSRPRSARALGENERNGRLQGNHGCGPADRWGRGRCLPRLRIVSEDPDRRRRPLGRRRQRRPHLLRHHLGPAARPRPPRRPLLGRGDRRRGRERGPQRRPRCRDDPAGRRRPADADVRHQPASPRHHLEGSRGRRGSGRLGAGHPAQLQRSVRPDRRWRQRTRRGRGRQRHDPRRGRQRHAGGRQEPGRPGRRRGQRRARRRRRHRRDRHGQRSRRRDRRRGCGPVPGRLGLDHDHGLRRGLPSRAHRPAQRRRGHRLLEARRHADRGGRPDHRGGHHDPAQRDPGLRRERGQLHLQRDGRSERHPHRCRDLRGHHPAHRRRGASRFDHQARRRDLRVRPDPDDRPQRHHLRGRGQRQDRHPLRHHRRERRLGPHGDGKPVGRQVRRSRDHRRQGIEHPSALVDGGPEGRRRRPDRAEQRRRLLRRHRQHRRQRERARPVHRPQGPAGIALEDRLDRRQHRHGRRAAALHLRGRQGLGGTVRGPAERLRRRLPYRDRLHAVRSECVRQHQARLGRHPDRRLQVDDGRQGVRHRDVQQRLRGLLLQPRLRAHG